MLTVQKHGVASSRDWKSQLYLSRYAHSSLQEQAWKWPVCSSVNTEDLESISTYTWREEDAQQGKRKQSLSLPLIYPATSLSITLGALSEYIEFKKKKEANSSYLIDKLSQINSIWVDRVPMQPSRRWVAKKKLPRETEQLLSQQNPAQLSSTLTARVPPYLNTGGLLRSDWQQSEIKERALYIQKYIGGCTRQCGGLWEGRQSHSRA